MASDTTKRDLPEPPLVGEVSPPQRVNGRPSRRSAALFGNGTLTVRQEAFCQAAIFDELSLSDAYRRAYSTGNMVPSTIWRRAHQISKNGKVKARLLELSRIRTEQDLQDAGKMRDRVLKGLLQEAEHAETASTRVQAWVALGKMFDISPPPKPVGDAQSLRLELEKRLRAFIGKKRPAPDPVAAIR